MTLRQILKQPFFWAMSVSMVTGLLFWWIQPIVYTNDTGGYMDVARAMGGFRDGRYEYWRTPGFPLLLLLTGVAQGKTLYGLITIQLIMGLAIPALIYFTLSWINRWMAMAVSVICSLSLVPFVHMSCVMTTQLYYFTVIVALFVASRCLATHRPKYLYLLAFSCFLAVMARPQGSYLYVPFLGVMLMGERKHLLHWVCSLGLVLALEFAYTSARPYFVKPIPNVPEVLIPEGEGKNLLPGDDRLLHRGLAFAAAKKYSETLFFESLIQNEGKRRQLQAAMPAFYRLADDLPAALEAMKGKMTATERVERLLRISMAQAAGKEMKDAADTLRQIEPVSARDEAATRLIGSLVEAGDLPDAYRLVDEVTDGRKKEEVLAQIGAAYVKVDVNWSMIIADRIKDPVLRGKVELALVLEFSRLGDANSAMLHASRIENNELQKQALVLVEQGCLLHRDEAAVKWMKIGIKFPQAPSELKSIWRDPAVLKTPKTKGPPAERFAPQHYVQGRDLTNTAGKMSFHTILVARTIFPKLWVQPGNGPATALLISLAENYLKIFPCELEWDPLLKPYAGHPKEAVLFLLTAGETRHADWTLWCMMDKILGPERADQLFKKVNKEFLRHYPRQMATIYADGIFQGLTYITIAPNIGNATAAFPTHPHIPVPGKFEREIAASEHHLKFYCSQFQNYSTIFHWLNFAILILAGGTFIFAGFSPWWRLWLLSWLVAGHQVSVCAVTSGVFSDYTSISFPLLAAAAGVGVYSVIRHFKSKPMQPRDLSGKSLFNSTGQSLWVSRFLSFGHIVIKLATNLARIPFYFLKDPSTFIQHDLRNFVDTAINLEVHFSERLESIGLIELQDLLRGEDPHLHLRFKNREGNINFLEGAAISYMVQVLKPKALFEIGTFDGFSALLLAKNAPPDAIVYTLNLSPESTPEDYYRVYSLFEYNNSALLHDTLQKDGIGAIYKKSEVAHRIQQLFGDSLTFDFLPWREKIDFCFVDGGHSLAHVKKDSETAFNLLGNSGVVIWHDYNVQHRDVRHFLNEISWERKIYHIRETRLAVFFKNLDLLQQQGRGH